MVHRCCISSCGMNVRVAEAKGLSYHGFPNKEPLREQWIQAIMPHLDKPEVFKVVPKYTRVCSRHFRKKDYSVDIKKRARLNSNAVPSVFPRKNSPIIIPNVLSSPTRVKPKVEPGTGTISINTGDLIPTSIPTTIVVSTSCVEDNKLITTSSPLLSTISWTLESNSEDGTSTLESTSLPREFLIESATLADDQLTLTIRDADCVSSSSLSQEDLSQGSNFSLNEDSNEAPHKKRKRRKWNRSAFDRPSKGKKTVSSDDVNIDGVGEALAEISLSTLLAIAAPELQDRFKDANSSKTASATEGSDEPNIFSSVSLRMEKSLWSRTSVNIPPDQVQHLNSIEQELLQSIQAVSLHCGGEPESGDGIVIDANSDVLSLNKSTHPFVHHSSEESIFSTEDESLNVESIDGNGCLGFRTSANANSSPTDADLLAQIVGIGLDDDRVPTVLEIENLANHFNSSLLTSTPITLSIGLEDLHLPSSDAVDQTTPSTASSSTEDIHRLFLVDQLSLPEHYSYSLSDSANASGVKSPANVRKKKAPEEVRLTGVTKKHKKEKMCGRFSVERFSNSDKDIEYYTGFSSYRNFEAFFRSLEAYVERLRVTDVMFGVTNLDKLQPETHEATAQPTAGSSSESEEFISPLPPPPAFDEPQKRRPFHGRSMSRIDELFMTVIRLKRKLPEKVLGHMFCISQPTVSRVIRAWTVLLSKLIGCYPVESASDNKPKCTMKPGAKSNSEHCYTSRGLGIPESFRQLFHSELAKSIVVTSVSAKDKKTILSKNNLSSISKRSKKSRLGENDPLSDNTATSSSGITITADLVDSDSSETINSGSNLMFNPCVDLEVEGNEFFQAVNFL